MKTLFPSVLLGLIWNFTVPTATGQALQRIPFFTPEGYDPSDYRRLTQGGDLDFVPGEFFVWRYHFEWTAKEIGGTKVISLEKGKSTMVLEKQNAQGYEVIISGIRAQINKPRNIRGPEAIFNFAPVDLDKATDRIILHRLGKPNDFKKSETENWYFYTHTVTRKRTRYVTSNSQTTGKVQVDGAPRKVELNTITSTPVEETITYQPYSFKVHFDDMGFVTKVEDFVDRTATWKSR